MSDEEVEITESHDKEGYEIIPVTPIRRLGRKIEQIEQSGTVPQLQNLINQIIELIRSNQKIVNEVVRANAELRNELTKLPMKIEELTNEMKRFLSLVEAVGKEEISGPSPDIMKPLAEQLAKLVEQNAKMLESDQAILEELDNLNKKFRATRTPVSSILSSYPSLKLRRETIK